jgi:hypothetical protein
MAFPALNSKELVSAICRVLRIASSIKE